MSEQDSFSALAVVVANVTKCFRTLVKPPGILNSIKALFRREYRNINALQDVSFTIREGEIVGLIGENGAGKTTLLKILSGIFPPDSGSVRCLGFKPSDREERYLRKIALLSGARTQLWWDLTPSDSFSLLASIYDLDQTYKVWSMRLAERLNVADKLDIQLRRLSLGERMKMEIIGALLHKPRLLFLDEPTLGLDLQSQSEIRRFVKEYVNTFNATAIITSHYMKDIEEICNRIVFLLKGKLYFEGTVSEIVKRFQKQVTVRYRTPDQRHTIEGEGVRITSEKEAGKIIQQLQNMGYEVVSIEVEDFTSVMTRFFASASLT